MTLGEAQRIFARRIPRLIDYIFDNGYECTFGDAYRSPRAFGGQGEEGPYGRPRSAHKNRLAIDLNLFLDGEYLSTTEAHRPLVSIGYQLILRIMYGVGTFKTGIIIPTDGVK